MPKKTKTIIPLGDRVLVEPVALKEKTTSGIILPDSAQDEKPEQGTVVAVGKGSFENGKRVPMAVKKGDTVVFSKYDFNEVEIEGKKYYIIEENKILAIVK